MFPKRPRQRAIDRAEAFTIEHLNGEDGIGAIFPAMVNSVLMFDVLGYPRGPSAPRHRAALGREAPGREGGRGLLPAVRFAGVGHRACCAMRCSKSAATRAVAQVNKGLDWLQAKQILDVKGDWAAARPDVRPGGWAFQYNNAHYPDVDDTAVVAMAMDRAQNLQGRKDLQRADRARARMDLRHAEQERRLGRVRRRQRPTTILTTSRSPTTARCSIRRPRT